ncbi:unnamed protein product, partial [Oppiella nova]
QFACGKYIESTVIPEHKSSQSTFDELQDELNRKLRVLIEEKSPNFEKRSFVNKLKDLYISSHIEAKGDEPLLDLMDKFGGWPVLESSQWNESNFNWFESYIKLRQIGVVDNMLISIFVDIDDKNSSKRVLYLDQPSLGLFDRDLLMKGMNDSSVAAYYDLMVKSAVLLGGQQNTAKKQMMEVLEFETLLANVFIEMFEFVT